MLQNFTINAVDILVIDFYALHIRTIDAFERCDYDVAKMGFKTGAGKT
jgi:hypothetical protein